MAWTKKGRIFNCNTDFNWSKSHAQLPISDTEHPGFLRVYYSSRDLLGKSRISYIDVSKDNPLQILYVHDEPILPLGKLGTFDENGMMPVALVNFKGVKYLYYAGWCLTKSTPYHNTIGLALSTDQGVTFTKYGEGPIMDRTPFEPYSTGTINIIVQGSTWIAWYQSVTSWFNNGQFTDPTYHLKYADSSDGINWRRSGKIAVDYIDDSEGGICSASVVLEHDTYQMWYSRRGKMDFRNNKAQSYRIGYAESVNGYDWVRKDESAGIGVSNNGWDSEMIAYPNIAVIDKSKYLFYNGNGFGYTGFGLATFEADEY